MKSIPVEEAVGCVLCHDMTQIVKGEGGEAGFKGPRFKKGHVVEEADIPVLLSMGKRNIYVWDFEPGMLHENDAAERLAALCAGEGCVAKGAPSEGKIDMVAAYDGVFRLDRERLDAVNAVDECMIATRHGNDVVRAGAPLAGTRVIPLVVAESVVEAAEAAAGSEPLMSVAPFKLKKAALISTGSEVKAGLIEDRFGPVIVDKLAKFGVEVTFHEIVDDEPENLVAALDAARATDVDMIVCTGGMSVDPDDNTPGAIKRAGARIVTYGAPVLPGAMLLVGYFEGEYGAAGATAAPGRPVMGLPGCVMYNDATVFDLVLPRAIAGIELVKRDFVELGEGGLCLRCGKCTYPVCPFGK
jgi:molybdenum cofactor synthesis domain-containing protein